eukprot:Sspe_Gene.45443::Locus_22501_Transcript_1_1_Confidence_1.000_Length_632::g.45443::m.45443/K02134/ATPeF1D, ATP5D, ATP16; F-type H+-transporting ATPase subunit delta
MGVLPGHAYSIEKVVPGIIEVEMEEGKAPTKYMTSGGWAHVNTDGSVDITTAECIPLDLFDLANVEKELASAQEIAKSGDDEARIRAEIGVSVLEPLAEAMKA